MYLCLVSSIVLYALCEVIAILVLTRDFATEVVTTIDDIPDKWEGVIIATGIGGLTTDIYLGMSQNICITGTTEGIVDTSVTQVDKRIATDVTLVTTTIQIFCFCQILYFFIFRVYRCNTFQVYRGAISRVELITIVALTIHNRCTISCMQSLTDNTLLATSEYL